MIIKICGLFNEQNIHEVVNLQPDWIGHIIYEPSKRFIALQDVPKLDTVKQIAVVVNPTDELLDSILESELFYGIQFHGAESVYQLEKAKKAGFKVIKAINIATAEEFKKCTDYTAVVNYFLFDTKGKLPGGNGFTFDWQVLKAYPYQVPFLLSGGIGVEQIEAIKAFQHPNMIGIDANSKLEQTNGLKDIELCKKLIDGIRA